MAGEAHPAGAASHRMNTLLNSAPPVPRPILYHPIADCWHIIAFAHAERLWCAYTERPSMTSNIVIPRLMDSIFVVDEK